MVINSRTSRDDVEVVALYKMSHGGNAGHPVIRDPEIRVAAIKAFWASWKRSPVYEAALLWAAASAPTWPGLDVARRLVNS